MDKSLAGQVSHARGHLATVAQEGVVIHSNNKTSVGGPKLKKMLPEISIKQELKGNQNLSQKR